MKKKSRKRVKKWFKKNWVALVTIIISVCAIIISAFSAYYSNETLKLYRSEVYNNITTLDIKRSELLLDLLSELKKLRLYIITYKDGSNVGMNPVALKYDIQKEISFYSDEELNAPILFYSDEKVSVLKKIISIADNPILPNEIHNKMNFLNLYGGRGSKSKDNKTLNNKYYHKIYFSERGQKNLKENGDWLTEFNNDCSLKEYAEKYSLLMSEISLWIDKTTNTRDKLNINNRRGYE